MTNTTRFTPESQAHAQGWLDVHARLRRCERSVSYSCAIRRWVIPYMCMYILRFLWLDYSAYELKRTFLNKGKGQNALKKVIDINPIVTRMHVGP